MFFVTRIFQYKTVGAKFLSSDTRATTVFQSSQFTCSQFILDLSAEKTFFLKKHCNSLRSTASQFQHSVQLSG